MAQRKNLLTVDYHYDDDTGMYYIGEIDFGVSALLKNYLEHFGADGMKEILVTLGHLAWEVKNQYYEISQNKEQAQHPDKNPVYDAEIDKLEESDYSHV